MWSEQGKQEGKAKNEECSTREVLPINAMEGPSNPTQRRRKESRIGGDGFGQLSDRKSVV